MSGGYLFGWNSDTSAWLKVECNPDGELLIDPTMLLENPPTEDEALKAPTSEWAYDHWKNTAAHHAKYTDANSRAAIGDLLDSDGKLIKEFNANYWRVNYLQYWRMQYGADDLYRLTVIKFNNESKIKVYCERLVGGYQPSGILIFDGAAYYEVITEKSFQAELDDYLENPPIEDSANTAPTSEWAYDHWKNVNAHHTKFTELEAQQACNLDGNIYHTIPGTSFQGTRPNVTDAHFDTDFALESWSTPNSFFCSVILPHGATVTAVLVDGNAGASSQMWIMYRVAMSNQAQTFMANALITNEDTSIDNPIIDNELYVYGIKAIDLSTNDKIFYARIKYTL